MQPTSHSQQQGYRFLLDVINQIFEIEKKAAALPAGTTSIQRNVNRLRTLFEHEVPGQTATVSFTYHNPLGEKYDETRTDCDASIAGSSANDLIITEVIKPIIWYAAAGQPKTIVQKAVVVAESRANSNSASIEATDTENTNG